MNILLLGSGGREHAMARSLAKSKRLNQLYIAPGNAGTSQHGTNIPLDILDFDIIKSCLEKHFFYKKDPIHPGILNTLTTSLADSGDIIIAINLTNAVGSNQYCCEEFTTELNDGRASVRIDYPDENGFYIYSYLGATDNGAMVIKTWSNGGGSGVFTNLLIVKVKKRLGANFDLFNSEGVFFDKQQVVLEKLLSIALGDRTETSISIKGNSVTINDKSINIPSH
jgi:phosphoribosylamine--glycine ligase